MGVPSPTCACPAPNRPRAHANAQPCSRHTAAACCSTSHSRVPVHPALPLQWLDAVPLGEATDSVVQVDTQLCTRQADDAVLKERPTENKQLKRGVLIDGQGRSAYRPAAVATSGKMSVHGLCWVGLNCDTPCSTKLCPVCRWW